jgi:cell wall hydrolase
MFGLEIGLVCLALNIYYEARNEPDKAQMAVALVTVNRAKRSGKSLCEVVFEPYQFSWTHESIHKEPKEDNPAWLKAQRIAAKALTAKDFTHGCRWFHREDVYPKWRNNLTYHGKYGQHLFYKERK